jgi:hypothetical protein
MTTNANPASLPSTLFQGIFIPVADYKPAPLPPEMFERAKAKRGDEKALLKYMNIVAGALEMDTEGMTRDGKVIKGADLALAIFTAQVDAEEAEAKRRAEAEAARKAHQAKMERIATLETTIKEAVKANPGKVTYADLQGWANEAKEAEAFLVIHGGEGEGSGIALRFKGAAPASGGGGKGRGTGGGKKGGTETRTSAWAEARRGMKKGDAFRIRRETMADGSRAYFDDTKGGQRIEGALSRYLLATYPDSIAAKSIKGYEERRKAAKGTPAPEAPAK